MSLQRRLLGSLLASVLFCLSLTFGTVYAVRLHVASAMADVQQTQSETLWLERLRLQARALGLDMRELVLNGLPNDTEDITRRQDFLDQLRQVARYTLQQTRGENAEELLVLGSQLRAAMEECLENAASSDGLTARETLVRIESELLPQLDRQLQEVLAELDQERSGAVDMVVVANTQLLLWALLIAVLGCGYVLVGTLLFRRWILVPVRRLETAARALGAGQLDYRVEPTSGDELGQLSVALNDMAERLTAAQLELRSSEAKYRALFQNLRDATLICNAQARILECQDGETKLLGRLGRECEGQSLLEVCPTGESIDWSSIIGRVLTRNEQVAASDLRIDLAKDPGSSAIVDVSAFPVRLGEDTYVVVVLRDVTEQRRSQEQLRRTEAMKATVTLARGVAHDFSGLLTTAIGSLSIVNSDLTNGRASELVRRAMRACGQAVGLSRTLLTFAGGEQGNPQPLRLRETIELILESLDESQLDDITVRLDLQDVLAYVDRDQFTEIVLNLVRNACEAMPEGGELDISLAPAKLPDASSAEGPATHALLTISDTGAGISPDVRDRLFEPFFTTKSSGTKRGRGMGLAVVYAAARNAGGLVDVQGTAGRGATFRVWLPLPE